MIPLEEPRPEIKTTYRLHYVSKIYKVWFYSDEYDTMEEIQLQIDHQKKYGITTMKIEEITRTSKIIDIT